MTVNIAAFSTDLYTPYDGELTAGDIVPESVFLAWWYEADIDLNIGILSASNGLFSAISVDGINFTVQEIVP